MKRFFVLLMTLAVILQAPITASANVSVNVEPGVEYTGNLEGDSDVDRYNLTLAKQSSVQIQMKHNEIVETTGWRVAFYNDMREIITEFTSFEDDTDITSRKIRIPSGSYYFEVTKPEGLTFNSSDYRIKAIVADESNGYFETENNDKKNYAQVINVNRVYTGNLQNENDNDYFRINLTYPANIKVQFTHTDAREETKWFVMLMDAEENVLTTFESQEDDLDVISERVRVPAGTYYIRVKRYADYYFDDRDYNLKAIVTDESNGYFERENNDKRSYSQTLELNKTYTGNLQNPDDLDYYRVNIAKPSRLKIQLKHSEIREEAVWKMILFTSEDEVLTLFESDFDDTDRTSNRVRVPKGTYYIKVSRPYDDDYSNINYTLKAIVDGETKGFYEREDNDKMSYAQTLRLNKLYTGNLQDSMDKDYYKLKLAKSGSYKLQFKHNGSRKEGDWNISVLTQGGTTKTSLTSIETQKSKSKNIKLSAGTYYVYVRRTEYGAFNNMDYRIGIFKGGH